MTIQGRITEIKTGEPLPGASITVTDSTAKYLGQGVSADQDGNFYIESPLLNNNYILVSHVGYDAVLVDPRLLQGGDIATIGLSIEGEDLPPVVVTPGKKTIAGLWVVALVVAAVVVHESVKTNKRVRSKL